MDSHTSNMLREKLNLTVHGPAKRIAARNVAILNPCHVYEATLGWHRDLLAPDTMYKIRSLVQQKLQSTVCEFFCICSQRSRRVHVANDNRLEMLQVSTQSSRWPSSSSELSPQVFLLQQ